MKKIHKTMSYNHAIARFTYGITNLVPNSVSHTSFSKIKTANIPILYHLDSTDLSKYTDNEINDIYHPL